MKKVKNSSNTCNPNKNQISTYAGARAPLNDPNYSFNAKDKSSISLGDKLKELENTLKSKKEQNNQLLNQLQNLSSKSNELVAKRNKLLVNINQQKSQIFVIKNKNKGYRNYLSELTSKESSVLSNNNKKEGDDVFRSIAQLSENISSNITSINEILNENKDKLKLNQNELLKSIPVDCLKLIMNKADVNN